VVAVALERARHEGDDDEEERRPEDEHVAVAPVDWQHGHIRGLVQQLEEGGHEHRDHLVLIRIVRVEIRHAHALVV